MSVKEKIKEAIKTKYAALGLAESVIDGVTESLEKTVTEESQIETAVAGVESTLKAFQKVADSLRNDKSVLQQEVDELKANRGQEPKPAEENEPEFPEGTPEEVKKLFSAQNRQLKEQDELLRSVQESLGKIESGGVEKSRKAALSEALSGAPEYYKEVVLSNFSAERHTSEEEFTSYVEGVKAKGRELAVKDNSHRPGSGHMKLNGGLDMERVKQKEEEYKEKLNKR